MKRIPLLDLKAQYRTIQKEIEQAVLHVLEQGTYIMGPEVKAFEKEVAAYCGVKHALGVANGTDALLLALDAKGIGPGDEVITTPFTFFATAEVISQLGATPVFVDIDPKTYNLDIEKVKEKITKKTKAIIPVHIFGQPVDMEALMELADAHQLFVLEDAAQAMGSEYKGRKVGSLGHAATFSFFPTKNLGGYGDGGMVVTNDDALAEKIRVLRIHGSQPKYHHHMVGYNSRLDEVQAACLRIKLRHLDEWNEARRQRAAMYTASLEGTPVITPYEAADRKHIYHLYILQAENREALRAYLQEKGIATGIYYPVPLHQQEVYASLGYKEGSLPISEYMSGRTFAIPLYPELEEDVARDIVSAVKGYYRD